MKPVFLSFCLYIFLIGHRCVHAKELQTPQLDKRQSRSVTARNFTLDFRNNAFYNVPKLNTDGYLNGFRQYPCYINVKVYKDQSLLHPAPNTTVTVLTLNKNTNQYIGYETAATNGKGVACILTHCYQDALVFVETDYEKLFLAANQLFPYEMKYNNTFSQTELLIKNVIDYGESFMGERGPIYVQTDKGRCLQPKDVDFTVNFFFTGPKDLLVKNPNAIKFDFETEWQPYMPVETPYKECFLKIRVNTPISNINITTKSFNDRTNFWYGTYITGPKEDPFSSVKSDRASCIEFRCPNLDANDATRIEGNLTFPKSISCRLTKIMPGLTKFNKKINDSSFQLTLDPGRDFGRGLGMYTSGRENTGRYRCYTGNNDYNIIKKYEMKPNTGFAIEYTCGPKSLPFGK